MAELTAITTALAAQLGAAFYPEGTGEPSAIGVDVRIFPGWPSQKQNVADMNAGKVNVTIFPTTAEKSERRYNADWQEFDRQAHTITMTLSEDGLSVTLGGTIALPQNVGLVVDGVPYVYAVQAGNTLTQIAAALATLISADRDASSSGPVLRLTPTPITFDAAHMGAQVVRSVDGLTVHKTHSAQAYQNAYLATSGTALDFTVEWPGPFPYGAVGIDITNTRTGDGEFIGKNATSYAFLPGYAESNISRNWASVGTHPEHAPIKPDNEFEVLPFKVRTQVVPGSGIRWRIDEGAWTAFYSLAPLGAGPYYPAVMLYGDGGPGPSISYVPQAFIVPVVRRIISTDGRLFRELRRTRKHYQVSIWAPTPALRSAASVVISAHLDPIDYFCVADGLPAKVEYLRANDDDGMQETLVYRRDQVYELEFATVELAEATEVGVVEIRREGGVYGVEEAQATTVVAASL